MSKTELEENLRATFDRAAASVPPAPDLMTRATDGARRAQRRSYVATGAAVGAVAVIATAGFALGGGLGGSTTPPPAATTPAPAVSSAKPLAVSEQLAGTWRPLTMDGFNGLKMARPDNPTLTFNSDGTWTGSDGCNGISGTFTIGQRGEFTGTAGAQRLIECANVPHTAVLQAARRIAADQTTLKFYAGDGREVAIYARAR
ncbi:META domain-containing protein [Kribbella sp. CA-253562]|uniref:META domain-containing protein n=1 Tax=Kribbella sp. CA-253562 TaxID=3239942 RepID=UPI003D8C5FDD